MSILDYRPKTQIMPDGKLGVDNPGKRAQEGFLPLVAAADDAKMLHQILPYARTLETQVAELEKENIALRGIISNLNGEKP